MDKPLPENTARHPMGNSNYKRRYLPEALCIYKYTYIHTHNDRWIYTPTWRIINLRSVQNEF